MSTPEANYITEEQKEAFKNFLNVSDWEKISETTKYSWSSVNNILNQRTQLNHRNIEVVNEAMRVLKTNIKINKDLIQKTEKNLNINLK